jgi:peptidoglycan/xylan/chitin deacetylase (PgdA/CDA1 family)
MSRSAGKQLVASVLASNFVAPLTLPFARDSATIFMMHRFADPDRGNWGHDLTTLRRHLEHLRRNRYDLVSLTELRDRLASPEARLAKTVAFTIDDGYADYATAAAPVFEAFDCPATVFVVTGVVDDGGWYWWDRVRVTFERAAQRALSLELGPTALRMTWSAADSLSAARSLVETLKDVPDAERRRIVNALPELVHADVGERPPAAYASMTWDEIRRCGARLTTFGPHTVTHPILARTTDDVARFEMTESWRRLSAETNAAVPVFCYPNGEADDAGSREFSIARDAGLEMAVTTRPGYVTCASWAAHADARYSMPRFPYPEDTLQFIQMINGVERVKMAIRSSLRSRGSA